MNMKRVLIPLMLVFLVAGCGGEKYLEEKTVLTAATKAMEAFASSMESADSPQVVAQALGTFSGAIENVLPGMKKMSARLDNQCGGACLDMFIEVRAQQGSIWLELDTGNSGPLLLAPRALKQLGLNCGTEGKELGGSAESDGSEASLCEITLDFVGLGPVTVIAKQQEMIYDGVINADTIRKLLLTMDLQTGEVWGAVREP